MASQLWRGPMWHDERWSPETSLVSYGDIQWGQWCQRSGYVDDNKAPRANGSEVSASELGENYGWKICFWDFQKSATNESNENEHWQRWGLCHCYHGFIAEWTVGQAAILIGVLFNKWSTRSILNLDEAQWDLLWLDCLYIVCVIWHLRKERQSISNLRLEPEQQSQGDRGVFERRDSISQVCFSQRLKLTSCFNLQLSRAAGFWLRINRLPRGYLPTQPATDRTSGKARPLPKNTPAWVSGFIFIEESCLVCVCVRPSDPWKRGKKPGSKRAYLKHNGWI